MGGRGRIADSKPSAKRVLPRTAQAYPVADDIAQRSGRA
jgi:hypothetical protein